MARAILMGMLRPVLVPVQLQKELEAFLARPPPQTTNPDEVSVHYTVSPAGRLTGTGGKE